MRQMRAHSAVMLLATIGLGVLAACTPTPRVEAPAIAGPPQQFPARLYAQAARQGEPVYRTVTDESQVVVYVHSEGPLAPTLGHSHVVSTGQIHGYILPRPTGGRADFYIAAEDLVVDDPELRASAGFTSELSEEQIEGTRSNMLNEVLEAHRYPYVLLHIELLRPEASEGEQFMGSLTLHGQKEKIDIPARVSRAEDRLSVTGSFRITHRQFGMTPYSAFAGALRVSEGLELKFDIVAERWTAPPQ